LAIASYNIGRSKSTELVAKHSQVYGKLKFIIELTDKLGYFVNKGNYERYEVLESFGIKDVTYHLVKINGINTLARWDSGKGNKSMLPTANALAD